MSLEAKAYKASVVYGIDKYFLRSVIYGGIMKVLPMEESRT